MVEAKTLPTLERLCSLVAAMAGQPVVVLADLVADRFISGTPKRISREAPVLILRFDSETLVPGGGANAVANVRALGGEPLPLGVVGDDESGRGLLAAFADQGIATGGILVRPGYRTPTKTRVLASVRSALKQQIVRFDVEDELVLGAAERERFAAFLAAHAGAARVAVVSDYGYGAAEPALLPLLGQGTPRTVLVDSRYRLGGYAGIEGTGLDGATPNEEEAEALLGRPLGGDDLARVGDAGRELRQRLGAGFLLITRGSRGMSLCDPSGVAHLPISGTTQVADVTGAGDTVIGAFALALAAGATPLEAAVLANYAAGVVVMKMGTATCSPAELEQALAAHPRAREEIRWAAS